MFSQIFFLLCHVKINKKLKKDKNKRGKHTISFRNWIIINIIPWEFRFFNSTKFSYERHFEKRLFTKNFSSRKCLHLKNSLLHQSDPYLLLESTHIQWNYLAVESVLLFLLKSLANRSSHLEVFRERGVPKFEIKIHEKYLWRSSFLVKLLTKSMQLY